MRRRSPVDCHTNETLAPPEPVADTDLAHNMVRINNVCIFPRERKRERESPVEVRVWTGGGNSLSSFCRSLSTCHTAAAASFCSNLSASHELAPVRFLSMATSFHATTGRGPFPPPCAHRAHRLAVVRLTGNVGHDMYVESLLDHFAQSSPQRHVPASESEAGEGMPRPTPRPPRRRPSPPEFYDALLLEAFWFHGQLAFERARRHAQRSWSLTMMRALLGQPRTYTVAHPKMRLPPSSERLPLTTVPPEGLCADELYVRKTLQAGHAAWGNVKHVAAMAGRIVEHLDVQRAAAPRRGDPRRPRITLFTRADAHVRKLGLGGDGLSTAEVLSRWNVSEVVGSLPADDPRRQVELFAASDVFIAPHGAASANAIFMRPGALYIELTPFCDATCLRGCYSLYTRTGFGSGDLGILDALAVSRAAACRIVRSVYPPFHASTGVEYHAVSLCHFTPRRRRHRPHAAVNCGSSPHAFKHEEMVTFLNVTASAVEQIEAIIASHFAASQRTRASEGTPQDLAVATVAARTRLTPFNFSCRSAGGAS